MTKTLTGVKDTVLDQLDREVKVTKRALENVPDGRGDWKPHPKSMTLGMLSHLVATMPSWLVFNVDQNELDVKPKDGKRSVPEARAADSGDELIETLEKTAAEARRSIEKTTEDHLQTQWRLLEGGKVVGKDTRAVWMREFFSHWAHHRGQLTVYLRLLDQPVPAIYGPSADDHRFL